MPEGAFLLGSQAQQLLAKPLHQAEELNTDKSIWSVERQAPENKAAEKAGSQPSKKRPSSSMDGDSPQSAAAPPPQVGRKLQ